jgi:histidinol-phosphate phosphatase family protein
LTEIEKKLDLKIKIIVEAKPRGTGGSLVDSLQLLDSDFFFIYGDIFLKTNLIKLCQESRKLRCSGILTRSTEHPQDSDLVSIDINGFVTEFHSKPHGDTLLRNRAATGVYFLRRIDVQNLKNIFKSEFFNFDRDGIPKLISNGCDFIAVNNTGLVKDIGTISRLKDIRINRRIDFIEKRKAIFLDRDGVINEEIAGGVTESSFKLLPNLVEAIEIFKKLEYLVIVISNQSILAKGLINWEELERMHSIVDNELTRKNIFIDAWYICPHHPEKGHVGEIIDLKIECECRKPKGGLVEMAKKDFNLNISKSWLVGDHARDLGTAVLTGLQYVHIDSSETSNLQFISSYANLFDFATNLEKPQPNDNF